ncbi:hypothetical protein C8Q75DRAFT_810474 [Abortiporus biennis]|nr:hypothetical protein C8Q75DRAFT_810474 [Abortiporus biennis]
MSFTTVSKIFAVLLTYSVSAHPSDVHPSSINGTEANSSSTFPPPSSSPNFKFLFGGQIQDAPQYPLASPFGPERIAIAQPQTNFTDMNGEVVATVVKGSSVNHGILSTNGFAYPDGQLIVQWADDGTYAFMRFLGVGDHHKRLMFYVHAETEANSTHADLNGKFLVGEFLYSPSVEGRVFVLYERSG